MPKADIGNLKGEDGGVYVNSSDGAVTPANFTAYSTTWLAAVCAEDTVLAGITQPNFDNESRLVGVTLTAGYVIYGTITSIELTSGLVQLFYGINPQDKKAIKEG